MHDPYFNIHVVKSLVMLASNDYVKLFFIKSINYDDIKIIRIKKGNRVKINASITFHLL